MTTLTHHPVSNTAAPTSSAAHNAGFPLTFNLYFHKAHLHLGEHASQPQHSVSLHAGFGSKPELVLHSGPDRASSTPLATAKTKGYLSNQSIITLPAYGIKEQLRAHWSLKSATYSFSIPVQDGASALPARFEWRPSRGDEVQGLDSSKWTRGWKLVRVDGETAEERGGKRSARDAGLASAGREVVAVWADNGKLSMDKVGKFQFLGRGATGELGERWAIMAVASVLRIWQVTYAATAAAVAAA
ncbi:uncharacterized protein BDZ99DRAFT_516065 [Mytilinidion resinicola]|uniref:Uncharacterized protein n=1 Tax=Mytilinidion resinicola TaxID=574789 RepID=A0A6A6Z2V8_9PEZI|nr:uncharacterized protein BDZ99DRAFT_516065 [Mytilinidion resinicola]KAF2815330.1 hypothetical protein BDZ99DRAFT_516065 [Mytilinidion resinicola]